MRIWGETGCVLSRGETELVLQGYQPPLKWLLVVEKPALVLVGRCKIRVFSNLSEMTISSYHSMFSLDLIDNNGCLQDLCESQASCVLDHPLVDVPVSDHLQSSRWVPLLSVLHFKTDTYSLDRLELDWDDRRWFSRDPVYLLIKSDTSQIPWFAFLASWWSVRSVPHSELWRLAPVKFIACLEISTMTSAALVSITDLSGNLKHIPGWYHSSAIRIISCTKNHVSGDQPMPCPVCFNSVLSPWREISFS